MTISFNKTYEVLVYRKVADGDLVQSKSPNVSHIYLDKTIADNVTVTPVIANNLIPVIYNINRGSNKTTITTNTMNILVSNISNAIGNYLYHKIRLSYITGDYDSNELFTYIEELVGSDNIFMDSTYIYFNNYDSRYLSYKGDNFIVELVVFLGNSSQLVTGIKKERLKSRIKITIAGSDFYEVKINCSSILEPIVYNKNWIEIQECVILVNNKPNHIYVHTYKPVTKTEIQDKNIVNSLEGLKDPLNYSEISVINSSFNNFKNLVSYNSYRSNLLLNVSLDADLYIYLQNNITQATAPFSYEIGYNNVPSGTSLVCSITNSYIANNLYTKFNPFATQVKYTVKPEEVIYYFDQNVSEDKYVRPQDITLGKNLLKINPEDLSSQRSKYVVVNNTDGTTTGIIQQNTRNTWNVGHLDPIASGLPQMYLDNLSVFLSYFNSKLNSIDYNLFTQDPIKAYITT